MSSSPDLDKLGFTEVHISPYLRGPCQWLLYNEKTAYFSNEAFRLEILYRVLASSWPMRDFASPEEDG